MKLCVCLQIIRTVYIFEAAHTHCISMIFSEFSPFHWSAFKTESTGDDNIQRGVQPKNLGLYIS